MAFGFYGTSEVCETAEAGAHPAFVSFNEENSNMPESTWLSQQFPHARVALRAENHMLLAIAARSGASLALLPHYIGRRVPGLRLCTLGPLPPPREIWLLIRRQYRESKSVRAMMQHLVDAFKDAETTFAD